MKNQITETINHRLGRLKAQVDRAPTAGDTDTAREFLAGVHASVDSFFKLLDDLDNETNALRRDLNNRSIGSDHENAI
jgi:hypothetical protein